MFSLPRKSRWWLVAVLTLAAAVATVFLAGPHDAEAELASAGIAPRPDLGALPSALADRVADCERRVRRGPARAQALGELATLYHANGFFQEAAQAYRTLLALDPNDARWPHLLANILGGFGQADETLDLERATLRLAPGYVPAHLRLGDVLLKTGRAAEALEAYTAALALEPRNPYAALGLARLEIADGRWTAARDRLLPIASGPRGDFSPAWSLLAQVYDHLGAVDEAAAARARGTRRYTEPPDPWVDDLANLCYDTYRLTVHASAATLAGNSAVARQLLERALTFSPDDPIVHRQLGLLLLDLRQFTGARGHFERAIQLAQDDGDNWSVLVDLFTQTGDREAGNRTLAAGLARCPRNLNLLLKRGRRQAAAGQIEEALATFAECNRVQPDDATAYVESALLHFRQGLRAEGEAALDRALQVEPEHPTALTLFAMAAIGARDEPAAVRWLRRAREQSKVAREEVANLVELFQQRFGHAPW